MQIQMKMCDSFVLVLWNRDPGIELLLELLNMYVQVLLSHVNNFIIIMPLVDNS